MTLLPSRRELADAPIDRVERDDGKIVDEIGFAPGSTLNPRNWTAAQKWTQLGVLTALDVTVSWVSSGFSPAQMKFEADFGVSAEVATLGLSLSVLGLAFGPMLLAPLSEHFGRLPLYILPYGTMLFFVLGTALVQNLGGFLVLRFLSGLFASVSIANLGGTIADMWSTHETGPPMMLFLWAATVGSPSAVFVFTFIAATRPWRDVFWASLGIFGGVELAAILVLRETRHSVILERQAKRLNRHSDVDVTVPAHMQKRGLGELFRVSLSRPFRFLGTEAIVQAAALYNAFLYGLSFLFNSAFTLVFKGKGLGTIPVGLTFLGLVFGISLGPVVNALVQEPYYQRRKDSTGAPEARLFVMRYAGVLLPISLFFFAWTSQADVSWVPTVIAAGLWGVSFYLLILSTYMYIEDSYGVFSASALAGAGLARNIAGAGFPLFGTQMYNKLGYEWASSLLGFLAILLAPIPFLLFSRGRALRQRSPWARQHMQMHDDDVKDDENGAS